MLGWLLIVVAGRFSGTVFELNEFLRSSATDMGFRDSVYTRQYRAILNVGQGFWHRYGTELFRTIFPSGTSLYTGTGMYSKYFNSLALAGDYGFCQAFVS